MVHGPHLSSTGLHSDRTFTTEHRIGLLFLLSHSDAQMPLPYLPHSPTIFRSSLTPKAQDQSSSQFETVALTKMISCLVQGMVLLTCVFQILKVGFSQPLFSISYSNLLML